MANDPVLQRSMFQKQGPSVAPAVGLGTGTGIGSVTTPDQNAQALRSMFQPSVSIGAPTEMLQQPVQSFQEGGLARLLPQYNFRERNFRMPPSYLERTDPARFEAERPAREAAAEEARLRAEASLEEQRARYAPEQERYRLMELARRQAVDDADARTRYPEPPSQFRRDIESLLPSATTEEQARNRLEALAEGTAAQRRALEEADRIRSEAMASSPGSSLGDYFRNLTPEQRRDREAARASAVETARTRSAPVSDRYGQDMEVVQNTGIEAAMRRQAIDDADALTRPSRGAATPPVPPPTEPPATPPPPAEAAPVASAAPARQKGSLELTLDGIRAERAEDRRQNALLALMQAGLAIAGGRSPNAISNIGAGGQAGIAAFAAMERASREDAAARRRDAIQLDTTRQQLALSERQLEKEPETIRTFRVLGGGDITKGFEIFNADKKLQAAVAITKDITASEEDRRAANEYIRGQLTKARTGGGSFSGFSATPVR
jgi:hypothetical protein